MYARIHIHTHEHVHTYAHTHFTNPSLFLPLSLYLFIIHTEREGEEERESTHFIQLLKARKFKTVAPAQRPLLGEGFSKTKTISSLPQQELIFLNNQAPLKGPITFKLHYIEY